MKLCFILLSGLFTCTFFMASAQGNSSTIDKALQFPDKLFNRITQKAEETTAKLSRQTEKYFHKLSRREEKLRIQLAKTDSLKAKELFGDAAQTYAAMQQKLKSGEAKLDKFSNVYSGHLDSMATALKFLEQNKLLGQSPALTAKYKEALIKLGTVQGSLNNTEEIKKYLQQRQQYLKQQLANTPLAKHFKKYQQEIYYYKAQLEEYKKMFEQPDKLEAKALQLLSEVPAFNNFFANFSDLGGIFSLPGANPATVATTNALQTRSLLQQDLLQRFGSGPNVQQAMQQGMGNAQSQLNQLKNKLGQLSSNGGDIGMPDFKPNSQKTKSFLQRLELTTNLQNSKRNQFFPTTTDLGLSAGYKINDKSIAGIGISYKMGWGKDIRHLAISHQGVGFRSYVDLKIKGGFWMSGGGEMNFRTQFRDFSILNDYAPWQKSALLGLTKKYKVSKKLKGNMQLLYDFLWKQQMPRTQPIVWRLGYNF